MEKSPSQKQHKAKTGDFVKRETRFKVFLKSEG